MPAGATWLAMLRWRGASTACVGARMWCADIEHARYAQVFADIEYARYGVSSREMSLERVVGFLRGQTA